MFRLTLSAIVAVVLLPGILLAAEPAQQAQQIDIFEGISKGQIDVRMIPKDEKKSQLLVTNKTDRPISVTLPPAVAGVPVLAQFMDIGGMNGGAPQAVGGGNNPFPGAIFNIAPEKVGRLQLTTVCLEHGKKTPNPRVEYQLKPIQDVATQPGAAEVCALLAAGKINQRIAQLAAWNLQNGKTWQQLASESHQGAFARKPLYSQQEIQAAQRLVKQAREMAKKAPKDTDYSAR